MRRFLLMSLFGLLAACTAPIAAPTVQPPTPTVVPSPTLSPAAINGKIRIGDRSLYMVCLGTGSPTVILDAGYNGTSGVWSTVQVAAMRTTRVCAYDRANLGSSDPAPMPRTIQDWVNDLDSLLKASGIPGPYILVGHSFAGMSIRLYTAQHPEQVAGIILVESSHPDQSMRWLAALPPESPSESKAIAKFRTLLRHDVDPTFDPMTDPDDLEKTRAFDSMQQARQAGTFGDIPLIVISRGQNELETDSKDVNDAVAKIWNDLQKDLLKLSTHSRQIVAESSGHMVPYDQPEVVVDAIADMVHAVR